MGRTCSAILVTARGHGRPIVFLPGFPLDHRIWLAQLSTLSDGFEVVLVDLPGFGADRHESVPETLSGFSDAVAETLMSARQRPACIIGHSFSGYIALQMYKDHPELFAQLVLVSTRATPDSEAQREKRLATARRLQSTGAGLEVEPTAIGLVGELAWREKTPAALLAGELVTEARSASARGALLAMASRPDLSDVLPLIRVPTLVVWGEADGLVPPAETQRLAADIPHARGVAIPGAGHLSMVESADRFSEIVRSFMSGLSAP
jgi:pimeloyl-ACP methyl ester carboxylesterase